MRKLDTLLHTAGDQVLVGELVALELLQGARDDVHAARIRRNLSRFASARMVDRELADQAARNYRVLRQLGITVRKTVDLIIGTFCIEGGHLLLQQDRDFEPMARHLGLRLA